MTGVNTFLTNGNRISLRRPYWSPRSLEVFLGIIYRNLNLFVQRTRLSGRWCPPCSGSSPKLSRIRSAKDSEWLPGKLANQSSEPPVKPTRSSSTQAPVFCAVPHVVGHACDDTYLASNMNSQQNPDDGVPKGVELPTNPWKEHTLDLPVFRAPYKLLKALPFRLPRRFPTRSITSNSNS